LTGETVGIALGTDYLVGVVPGREEMGWTGVYTLVVVELLLGTAGETFSGGSAGAGLAGRVAVLTDTVLLELEVLAGDAGVRVAAGLAVVLAFDALLRHQLVVVPASHTLGRVLCTAGETVPFAGDTLINIINRHWDEVVRAAVETSMVIKHFPTGTGKATVDVTRGTLGTALFA
jgi:hypothetical protein